MRQPCGIRNDLLLFLTSSTISFAFISRISEAFGLKRPTCWAFFWARTVPESFSYSDSGIVYFSTEERGGRLAKLPSPVVVTYTVQDVRRVISTSHEGYRVKQSYGIVRRRACWIGHGVVAFLKERSVVVWICGQIPDTQRKALWIGGSTYSTLH